MRKKNTDNSVKELLSFIDASPSCFHAVANLVNMLDGYEKLDEDKEWKLKKGGKYYIVRNDSSVIAFRIPKKDFSSVYITAAHSDSPCFRIKEKPAMVAENHYTKLNTEKYGGMIMNTWFDRPLSVAGRVIVKQRGKLVSKLVNVDKDILLIPSVAIHMNRSINDGMKYDAQVDTIPLFGDELAKGNFEDIIAKAAGVKKEDILGQDLFTYVRTPGSIWGANDEFISSRALDDLQCAFACMKGFVNAGESSDKLSLCCVFDNEEVGSMTSQGADSSFLSDTLERINEGLGFNKSHLKQAIAAGFMVSADNAHAVHPNHPEYADPTNRPYINGGIVIKIDGAKRYSTDGISEAFFRDICDRSDVPVQTFANKSNIPGGTTLGNISNSHISIKTVDIGLPQLAMHSAYETAGAKDTDYLIKAIGTFFA